jgi:hypothetical protein
MGHLVAIIHAYTNKQEQKMSQVTTAQNNSTATAVNAMSTAINNMNMSDSKFAADLLKNFNRTGHLSPKQLYWVVALTARAVTKPAAAVNMQVNFAPIAALFARASTKIKRIKIRLQTVSAQPVAFSRAGPLSKYTGQILITDGQSFGQNKFFGRIDTSGNFFATAATTSEVQDLIRAFAANPAGVASSYGHLTHECCFCSRGLTDQRSTQVGYGPVCADNFGLAWG